MSEEIPVPEELPVRLKSPWKSKDEVPKDIWDGFLWSYPHHTEEEYLEVLNYKYYYYWIEQDEKKKRAKESKDPLRSVPFNSCFVCEKKISESQAKSVGRLCATHADILERNGSLSAHGITLHHSQGDQNG